MTIFASTTTVKSKICPIKDKDFNIQYTLSLQGSVLSVKNNIPKTCPDYKWQVDQETGECVKVPKPKRGKITSFSKSSRKRLLQSLYSVTVPPSLFITLTYPKEYPQDSREWKRHLDIFSKRLARKFPNAYFDWKLEPQERGAPHFHLLGSLGTGKKIFNYYYLTVFRLWVSLVWYQIVASGDRKHLRAGTRVDVVDSTNKGKLKSYIAKYVGKTFTYEEAREKCPGWGEPGRIWGTIGRQNKPVDKLSFSLSSSEFLTIRRVLVRWLKASARNMSGLGYLRSAMKQLRYSNILKFLNSFTCYINTYDILRLLNKMRLTSWYYVKNNYLEHVDIVKPDEVNFLYNLT